MKKMTMAFGLLILMFSKGFGQDEIKGIWLTPDGETKVEIYRKDSANYHGKIIWIKDYQTREGESPRDKMNPDKSLRDRTIMGMDLLENLVYDEGEWSGTIYVPKKGRTLDAVLSLEDKNQLNLNVSFRSFSRTRQWQRVDTAE